jgi:hypothetical protein
MAYFQLAAFLVPYILLGVDYLVLVYTLPGLVDVFCDVFGKPQPPRNRVTDRGIGVTKDTKLVA